MKKKSTILILSSLLVLLLVAGGTMAWFTATADPVENKFKAGTVELDLKEKFYNCGAQNVNPGDCFYKLVYVKNTGTKKAKIRVKLDNVFEDNLPTAGVVKYNLAPGWTLGNDGYAYYNYIVPAGWYTPNLFKYDRVCFDGPKMDNKYQGKKFTMTIGAEAVQASHNAPWSAVAANAGADAGIAALSIIEDPVEEGGLETAPQMSPEMQLHIEENPEGILEEY